jgi:hypothetical protein
VTFVIGPFGEEAVALTVMLFTFVNDWLLAGDVMFTVGGCMVT